MASLSTHYKYYSGWSQSSSLINDASTLGPYDGNSRCRSVFKISLNSITSTQERTTMTVSITTATVDAATVFTDSFYYNLTSSGPGSSYSVQGTSYDSGSTESFSSKTGYTRTTSFEIDISGVPYGTNTVYLWMYANCSISGRYSLYTTTGFSVSESSPISIITPVTTGSITTSSGQIYKPTDTVSVSWNSGSNGTGNTVTGYNAYLRFGYAPTTNSYDQIITGLTSTSTSFSITNATRGTSVYVGVRALGSNGNGSIVTKNIGVINSLPNAPTFTASGTALNTINQITYTVSAGSDSNSQTLSLYYSLNNGSKKKFTSPLVISSTTSGVVSGTNSIVFYTYDTKEYSTASNSHTFTATFAPVIGGITTTHTSIENMNGNTSILASETKIVFSMSSGTAKNILLYVRSGTSSSLSGNGTLVSSDYYSYNESTGTITIPIIGINTSLIAEGNYFQFAFKVSDGTVESNLSEWQTYKRRPKAPILPTYDNYSNHADNSYGAIATSTFYKNYVTINFTNPDVDTACAKISSIAVVATYGSGSKEYACSTSSGSASVKMDLTQVNPGTSTTFKFKVVDAAGQTKTSSNVLTLTKTSNLVYGGNTVNVTNDNLKPMTNASDFQIAHPIAQATGTPTIIYKYYMQIGSTKKEITAYTSTKETDQIKILITAANINALALSLVTDTNLAYDTIITVLAADGFATTATLTKTIKVNFTEPPTFLSNNFKIKHDYYTNRGSITVSTGTEIVSNSDLNIRMVNGGEGIIFMLPKAVDPNDDISEYRIFLARNDFIDTSSVLSSEDVIFGQTPWLIIPYSTLTSGISDTDYYYYLFKASQYTKNEYFYFKLQARDATGNISTELICPNYIIGCRTVAPIFSAGNVRVDRVGTDVTLTYNFKITDLGGSAKSSGWEKAYYANYPNFERTISGYTPEATLQIQIAPDQSFTTDVVSSDLITFSPTDGESLVDFTHTQTKLSGFASSHAKIFMRFTLTVSYGLQDNATLATVTSIPQIYTYFGAVPTVAHRAHKVGINTNALGDDDVLVVENYQGTRYVKFKGTDASNASQTYEITFDLLNGTITGAVINCGEW